MFFFFTVTVTGILWKYSSIMKKTGSILLRILCSSFAPEGAKLEPCVVTWGLRIDYLNMVIILIPSSYVLLLGLPSIYSLIVV